MKHIALLFTLLLAAVVCHADEPVIRPVSAWYTFEAGSATIDDTYLTIPTNSGWHLALGYQRMQAMRQSPQSLVMQLSGRLAVDRTHPDWSYQPLWGADLKLDWAVMRRFDTGLTGLRVYPGLMAHADLGVMYIDRAGNNPADAKCAVTVGLTALAVYNFNIVRLPVTVSWQPSLQLAGVCFGQQYDEPYYEIYLGNRHGLAHFASPFNRLDLTNSVNIDLRLGTTVLRVGYRSDILSSKINNIVTNRITNAFVFGIGGEWISLSRNNHLDPQTKIISAIY